MRVMWRKSLKGNPKTVQYKVKLEISHRLTFTSGWHKINLTALNIYKNGLNKIILSKDNDKKSTQQKKLI